MSIRPLRALAASAAVVLVAGGLALAAPLAASAHAGTIAPVVVCADDGSASVTWTVTNDHPEDATVTDSTNAAIATGATIPASDSASFLEAIAAAAAGTTTSATIGLRWADGFEQHGIAASTTVDGSCTPPVTPPPADVVAPLVQDYVTCDGSAFVLDNTGSTVDVVFTVAGKTFPVAAGAAVHTDADGYLFPADIGPVTITTTPGDRSWTFAPATDCASTPPTEEPTPTDTPTPTPTPTDEPTPTDTPSPSGAPTPTPTPTLSPSPSPTGDVTPTASPTPTQVAVVVPSAGPTTPAAATSVRSAGSPDELAFTGSPLAMGSGIAAALALLTMGGLVLALTIRHRRRANR